MKTTRATRRTVRRWALRIRTFPLEDFVSIVTLQMPESDRAVLRAMLNREISRRARARNAAYNCGVGCALRTALV